MKKIILTGLLLFICMQTFGQSKFGVHYELGNNFNFRQRKYPEFHGALSISFFVLTGCNSGSNHNSAVTNQESLIKYYGGKR